MIDVANKADNADFTIDEIMSLPDVVERVKLYHRYSEEAIDQLYNCSTLHDNCVVLDLIK